MYLRRHGLPKIVKPFPLDAITLQGYFIRNSKREERAQQTSVLATNPQYCCPLSALQTNAYIKGVPTLYGFVK